MFIETTRFFTPHSKLHWLETNPSALSKARKAVMACSALVLVFVPVQTNLPFLKSKNVAKGDFNLKDNPGNFFQLHLDPSNFKHATPKSTPSLNEPVNTTFSTVITKSNTTINNNIKIEHLKNNNNVLSVLTPNK